MIRRHTKRDVVRLFKERGLRANRLLGQNFLVDHNVLNFICSAAELSDGDLVLEIGAGTGLLTAHLAECGARVLAVEIDGDLFEMLSDYVGGREDVHLLHGDVHGKRRALNPDVAAALERELRPGRTLKVVSNLPYCISSDVLVSLLEMEPRPAVMVVTVQKEFAARLLARRGSRTYGALTVLLRAVADVKRLRDLPPPVFWPVPKVGSSVIRIEPSAERAARIKDYAFFKTVVRALFGQRRKTAAAALRSMARPKLSKRGVASALAAAGISEGARGDGLGASEIVALANALAESAPGPRTSAK